MSKSYFLVKKFDGKAAEWTAEELLKYLNDFEFGVTLEYLESREFGHRKGYFMYVGSDKHYCSFVRYFN